MLWCKVLNYTTEIAQANLKLKTLQQQFFNIEVSLSKTMRGKVMYYIEGECLFNPNWEEKVWSFSTRKKAEEWLMNTYDIKYSINDILYSECKKKFNIKIVEEK